MSTAGSHPDAAWDRLLDLIDHLAGAPDTDLTGDVERTFAVLCAQGAAEGTVDRELDTAVAARWLTGMLAAHRNVRAAHSEVAADDDLAVLRVIVTRWLHPARVDH